MSKSKVKVKLNRKGVRELLKSAEMLSACHEVAEEVANRAGDGYGVEDYPNGKTRVNVSVRTITADAVRDNAKNNTLLKALGR